MNYDVSALRQLKENATWYFILGIGLIILGTIALFYAYTATIISVVVFGTLLTFGGIFEAIKAFTVNKWKNFFLHLFLSALYLIAGIFIIAQPTLNAVTLTLLLAIFFIISGIAKIVFAATQNIPHKTLVMLNGILALILGILIWIQWPYSGFWVLGMFLGIDLIFTGFTWIQLSMMAKNMRIENH